jgi:hypothetical protein
MPDNRGGSMGINQSLHLVLIFLVLGILSLPAPGHAQEKLTVSYSSGATLKVEDVIDDSPVVELEKQGSIDRIYKQ